MKNKKKRYAIKAVLFLGIFSLFAFNHFNEKTEEQMATEQNPKWKVGAKIYFDEESSSDYIGTKEINKTVRESLKQIFDIKSDTCADNAKPLLKKENGAMQVTSHAEKNAPDIPEEMHATLLYTSARGFNSSETLYQAKDHLFNKSIIPPSVKRVAITYGKIIQSNWKFKISEIMISKSKTGDAVGVIAKLLFNDNNEIYYNNHPVSAGLHITLVICFDGSLLLDQSMTDRLVAELNKKLQGKFVKVSEKDGVCDLEFGLHGKPWRIRAGKRFRK